jgi:hypothetical protein
MKLEDVIKEFEQTGGFLLTDKDRDFAKELSEKFAIPFEEICIELGMIRGAIQVDIDQYNNLREWNIAEYQALKDSLEGIEAIHVITSKGPVKFSTEDVYYRHFEKAIKKIRASCERIVKSTENPFSQSKLNKMILGEPLMASLYSASPWNWLVITGRILVYFEVDPKIMTEPEWDKNRIAQDYNHYLADIVKSRLRKFQK